MSLSTITKGKLVKPPRMLLMGVPGIGKTTLAAQAPAPIFIQAEEGADVVGCDRFPLIDSLDALMGNLRTLATEEHQYRTVVIDSLDPVQAWIERVVRAKYTEKQLAYGKGTDYANEEWRTILDALTWLRNNKGMIVVLIAHTAIKRFENPETDPYDRFVPRLPEKCANLISAWSDAHLFANYKVFTKKSGDGMHEVVRGISTGERVMYTEERPAHMGKNRYTLPYELPMSWESFANAVATSATK